MACKCQLCGTIIDSRNGEMVMLDDHVWLMIANKKDILCHGCIEQKLGRHISSRDLKYHDHFLEGRIPVNILFSEIFNLSY
jgi:hypothetical protein